MSDKWDGSVIIWPKRILFAGEAAKSETHHSHTLMIIVARDRTFGLQLRPEGEWKQFKAALIKAGTQHCMDGQWPEFVMIIHLLPETEEAREIQRKYLAKNSVYEFPDNRAGKLSEMLKALESFWLLQCEGAHKLCQQIIDELIGLSSTRLGKGVDTHVRRAIDELYSRMNYRLKHGQSPEDFFTASSIVAELRLNEFGWTEEKLKREFKKSTGASFNDYVKLLRFRATLVKIGDIQAKFRADRKVSKANKAAQAVARGLMKISLTEAAMWMGWAQLPKAALPKLDRASKQILGINPSSLTAESLFIPCEEHQRQ